MWAAMLILMGVGPLAAAALASPRSLTELLYRGLTLVVMVPVLAGGIWGVVRGPVGSESGVVHAVQAGLIVLAVLLGVVAWGLGSGRKLAGARAASVAAGVVGLLAASHLLHDDMVAVGTGLVPAPKVLAMGLQTVACVLAMGALGLPPVVLMGLGQGWTRALVRWEWAWWGVSGAVVVQSAAAGAARVVGGGSVGLPECVRWAGVLAVFVLAVWAGQTRRRGGVLRLPGGSKIRLGAGVLVLIGWGLSVLVTAWGLVLLRAGSWAV